jgi:hypothetical protein
MPGSTKRISTRTESWHVIAEAWAADQQAFEIVEANHPCVDVFLNFLCLAYRFKSTRSGTRLVMRPIGDQVRDSQAGEFRVLREDTKPSEVSRES